MLRGVVTSTAVATILTFGVPGGVPWSAAHAADLGGSCCADLEERVAELEATTPGKGNREVSLSVYGLVNQAIMFWDDGTESNAYLVGNAIDPTLFGFQGEASIEPGWKAGYRMEFWAGNTLSEDVDQSTDDPATGLRIWQSYWFVESEKLGKISLGMTARATDGASEVDLSESSDAGFSRVSRIGGNFALRRSDGRLASAAWADVYDHFNGDTADVIRYETPDLRGFTFAASWGEDDISEAALYFEGGGGGFKLGAAMGYAVSTDENGIDGSGDTPSSTVMGSFSVLHEATGFNATIAAGHREFDVTVEDADGAFRAPEDARFVYAKLGWIAELNGLGFTAFHGEYGHFKDYVSAGVDADGVASLSLTDVANVCAAAGDACRVTGNSAEMWGLGAVQHIKNAEMRIYIGWRRYSADFNLADVNGSAVSAAKFKNFDTVIAGSKISF